MADEDAAPIVDDVAPTAPTVPETGTAPEVPKPAEPVARSETPKAPEAPEYDPPPDLPEVEEEAKCETDVVITLLEPETSGTPSNSMQGFSWTGVKEIEVTLTSGLDTFTATTTGGGVAEFSDVPCGVYTISLKQDEFKIRNLDTLGFNVTATRKSGREKEIKILRQLLTVEMFRLETLMIESLRRKAGFDADPNLPGDLDTWGHHWIKFYSSEADTLAENPSESFGWWPTGAFPDRKAPTLYPLQAVMGELNGGQANDPYHTKYKRDDKYLEDVFFPWVTNGKSASEYKSEIRSKARGFSSAVSNEWSWRTDSGGWHCKTFQAYLMRESNVWKRVGTGVGDFGWSTSN